MLMPSQGVRILVATKPVDFRKGHAGLSLVIQTVLGRDPYSGAVFVFRSKRGDRIKILLWDQTGLVLVYKHLEGGQFQWPRPGPGPALPGHGPGAAQPQSQGGQRDLVGGHGESRQQRRDTHRKVTDQWKQGVGFLSHE